MYKEAFALLLLLGAACSQLPQSPTIDCSLRLRSNHLTSSFTLSSEPLPHDITCVRSSTSVDIIVKAANGTSITDIMLQVFISGAPSGLFLSPDDRNVYAIGCGGRSIFSQDQEPKRRIDVLWFNSLGFDLTTKLPTCMVTLTDSQNRAWQSIAVPSITNEEFERQRLNALLGVGNNMFAEDAQPTSGQQPMAANAAVTATSQAAPRPQPASAASGQEAVPDKILDISLSSVMSRSPGNAAVRFSSSSASSAAPNSSASTQRPNSVERLRSASASETDFMNPFNHPVNETFDITTPAVASQQQQPTTTTPTPATTTTTTAAPTSTTTTTTPAATTTTPTTTTTTPTTTTTTTTTTAPTTTTTTTTSTTTTTPATTTTTPTTTTTTPTTTTTTAAPTTTTTTTTPTTTTTTTPAPTTRASAPPARRPTRPVVVQAVSTRRPTLPTTTSRPTTTTTTPTTTTQPVNLDLGRITVVERTYEHHCLNGNLKRVLIPHTGCRHYMTLMNGLPGAFSKCPITGRDGQQCFDVVTCSCVRCHHSVCSPSFDPERQFDVTIYNTQRDPIGRIVGEFVPNRGGGYNENIQISGITDPGYLPLRNADGSIQTTPPPARRTNSASNNRRGPTRNRGSSNRGSNITNRQRGINGVISNLLSFF